MTTALEPRLSVIMPVFNEHKTIREIIAKVLAVPIEIELVIVLSEFASPPVENDTRLITMGGVIYRVASVMTGADTVSATLGLRKSN